MSSAVEVGHVQRPELAKHDSSVLDLAFVMDCTGSMGSYIAQARDNIRKIVEEIVSKEKSDIRMALIEYRDHPPEDRTFVTRPHDFTGSVSKMKGWLEECRADGGGDTPEAVADGLHHLLKLSWREESTKICVFIADAPPHGLMTSGDNFPKGCPDNIDPMEVGRELAQKGVTIYMVGCEPSITPYKQFFMAVAYMTGGQYVPLTGARLLTQVIIGGAQEELSLDQWMAEVEEEVVQELRDAGDGDLDSAREEVVSHRVHEKLKKRGAHVRQLQCNNVALSKAPKTAQHLSNCVNMSEVRDQFELTAPTRPARSSGARHKHSRKKERYCPDSSMLAASRLPPGSVAAPPPPPPSVHMLRYDDDDSDDGDLEEMDSAAPQPVDHADSYCTAETEIAYEQAERMVKRAIWKNKK